MVALGGNKMPRDEHFYDERKHLINYFGWKNVLSISDVAQYTGRSPQWCKNAYYIDPDKGITVNDFARWLSYQNINHLYKDKNK